MAEEVSFRFLGLADPRVAPLSGFMPGGSVSAFGCRWVAIGVIDRMPHRRASQQNSRRSFACGSPLGNAFEALANAICQCGIFKFLWKLQVLEWSSINTSLAIVELHCASFLWLIAQLCFRGNTRHISKPMLELETAAVVDQALCKPCTNCTFFLASFAASFP
jgi:hypothetical protein